MTIMILKKLLNYKCPNCYDTNPFNKDSDDRIERVCYCLIAQAMIFKS